MHEMAIAQGILDITLDNAAQSDAKKVITIKLLVGQMTEVEPEAMRFCFSALAEGTIAAKAELKIKIVPLVVYCQDCGRKFVIERYRFLCSACGSANVKIISGRELQVEYLEVD
ncbi:hydrogenase nickel incorporation protein HypA/HybF [Sporomusaceae bacterium BoRhaA]|uniref:hydrogenase maturation nickel metallochaperone HypA n=1 Tax=Pelorhabdus rhamnosifermentans TaxID=2772457 RepID=UPI001C062D18|nr:hydrogenase maturation nickel metallochaperone HypA [Pelorhabdus rhamnosifermentans]MBU2702370.1 hydrogenase nickel incorporation protein HypA/HybF [Pelorhabdus rhamnosifermentans]